MMPANEPVGESRSAMAPWSRAAATTSSPSVATSTPSTAAARRVVATTRSNRARATSPRPLCATEASRDLPLRKLRAGTTAQVPRRRMGARAWRITERSPRRR
jgi:hypothetical protein